MTVEINHKWWILSPDSNWFGCAFEGDRDTCTNTSASCQVSMSAENCKAIRRTPARAACQTAFDSFLFTKIAGKWYRSELNTNIMVSPPSDRISFLVANRATFSHSPQQRHATSPQSKVQFDKIMPDNGEGGNGKFADGVNSLRRPISNIQRDCLITSIVSHSTLCDGFDWHVYPRSFWLWSRGHTHTRTQYPTISCLTNFRYENPNFVKCVRLPPARN